MPCFAIIFIGCLLLALTDNKHPFAWFLLVLISPVLVVMALILLCLVLSSGQQ